MTRPSGASFAQFFPAAPRVARDRAVERERAKSRSYESHCTRVADTNGHRTPTGSQDSRQPEGIGLRAINTAMSRSHRDDALQPHTDDSESLAGDNLNTIGSTSSHESSSSSVFSTSAQHNAAATAKNLISYISPLTAVDSPANSYIRDQKQFQQAAPAPTFNARSESSSTSNGFVGPALEATSSAIERIPARDPGHSIKVTKKTYDPLLDKKASASERKRAKPVYEEHGLVRVHIDNINLEGGGGGKGGGGGASSLSWSIWLINDMCTD